MSEVRVYVAGPYTQGDTVVNVRKAIDVAEELWVRGFIPFVPHLTHFWQMLHTHTYDEWLALDFAWLERCDALLRMEGYSPGADREVSFAEAHGIPVYYSIDDLIQAKEHMA